MHCPINKLAPKKRTPHIIEGTMGNLTDTEKDAICKSIQEGWNCGHIAMGTHSISFNVITTRRSIN
jgi:hypothetical protein